MFPEKQTHWFKGGRCTESEKKFIQEINEEFGPNEKKIVRAGLRIMMQLKENGKLTAKHFGFK